jgi:hypothetical protein
MLFGNHRLTDRIGIHTEYQWRRSDFVKNWQQSLMRIGIDFSLNQNVTVTSGYGWIVTFPYGTQPVAYTFNENRIWQQLVVKQNVGRVYFNHRYRLEQRFIETKVLSPGDEYTSDGFNFRQRVRYRFMVTVPFNHKELVKNTLFLSWYDEPFLGFGRGIGKNILDQNRFYAALGWQLNAAGNIQVGYMNQFVVKPDGLRMERNHTLQVAATYNLDFRKKSGTVDDTEKSSTSEETK